MSKRKKEKIITEETDIAQADETAIEDEETEVTPPAEAEAEAVVEAEETANETTAEPEVAEERDEKAPLTLEEELEIARQEAEKNLDNWQRTAAELANYKRRQEEQRKLQRDRIKGEVMQGVVSALDDMDLAFQNLPAELDGQIVGWVEGFRLVQRKLDKILDEQNVMVIDTNGKFDPNFHEAVSSEDSEAHEEGDIIAELRKGYQIGSRVIRPALVRVAK